MILMKAFELGDSFSLSPTEKLIVQSNGLIKGASDCKLCHFGNPAKCGKYYEPCVSSDGSAFLKKIQLSQNNDNTINPNYYKQFGVEVDKIIWFILEHEDNKDKSPRELACMYAELKYRLRAGFKTDDFETDMKKAMNYNKMRK